MDYHALYFKGSVCGRRVLNLTQRSAPVITFSVKTHFTFNRKANEKKKDNDMSRLNCEFHQEITKTGQLPKRHPAKEKRSVSVSASKC